MKVLREWPLAESLRLAEVDCFPEDVYRTQAREHLAADYPILPWREKLDETARNKLSKLKGNLKNQYELRLAVLKKSKLLGWTYGWQDSVDQASFFMGASLVMPEIRRRGVYTELVKKTLEVTGEKGFQSIWSMHVMTNNPVIIAKLRLGFFINGFECNAIYGTMVRLAYHHSDLRRQAARFRAGAVREDDVRELLMKQTSSTTSQR